MLSIYILLLSDLGNARVIIEAVLLIETITPISLYCYRALSISIISTPPLNDEPRHVQVQPPLRGCLALNQWSPQSPLPAVYSELKPPPPRLVSDQVCEYDVNHLSQQ